MTDATYKYSAEQKTEMVNYILQDASAISPADATVRLWKIYKKYKLPFLPGGIFQDNPFLEWLGLVKDANGMWTKPVHHKSHPHKKK